MSDRNMRTRNENLVYWEKRVQENEIFKGMDLLASHARDTAAGRLKKCQFVSGIGGVGKTFVYQQAFVEAGVPYEIMRAGSVLGMVQLMERCARERKIVILDDPKRAVITAEDFINMLQAVVGPEPRRFSYVIKGKKTNFNFDGLVVILLTNYSLQDETRFAKRVSDSLQPLMSRVISDRIDGTRIEVFEHACFMAIARNMLYSMKMRPSLAQSNLALEYLTENMHVLPDVSCRTLVKIVELQQQKPNDWRRTMDRERTRGTPYCKPYVGEIPQIIVDPLVRTNASIPESANHSFSSNQPFGAKEDIISAEQQEDLQCKKLVEDTHIAQRNAQIAMTDAIYVVAGTASHRRIYRLAFACGIVCTSKQIRSVALLLSRKTNLACSSGTFATKLSSILRKKLTSFQVEMILRAQNKFA